MAAQNDLPGQPQANTTAQTHALKRKRKIMSWKNNKWLISLPFLFVCLFQLFVCLQGFLLAWLLIWFGVFFNVFVVVFFYLINRGH